MTAKHLLAILLVAAIAMTGIAQPASAARAPTKAQRVSIMKYLRKNLGDPLDYLTRWHVKYIRVASADRRYALVDVEYALAGTEYSVLKGSAGKWRKVTGGSAYCWPSSVPAAVRADLGKVNGITDTC